ncbi:MAG: hypothetical protein KDA68_11050, partial [Planctomycetaceae bacterium]|nr:hypothetical protein [Planctomycetaceae bacterium]
MPLRRPTWLSLVIPSAIPPLLAAGGFWNYSPEIAVAAAAGGLTAFLGAAYRVSTDTCRARRQLSLSTTPTAPIGSTIADGLLADMGTYIDELKHSLQATSTA